MWHVSSHPSISSKKEEAAPVVTTTTTDDPVKEKKVAKVLTAKEKAEQAK